MRPQNNVNTLLSKLIHLMLQLLKMVQQELSKGLQKLKKKLRFSITFKITVVYGMIFALLLLLISGALLIGSGFFLINQARNHLKSVLDQGERLILAAPGAYAEMLQSLAREAGVELILFDGEKQVIFQSGDTTVEPADLQREQTGGFDLIFMVNQPMVIQKRVDMGNTVLQLRVSKHLLKEQEYMAILMVILASSNFIGLIISLILGGRSSKRMLKPIERMTKTVQHISINDLDTRLDVSGAQDELKDLAETFNAMLDRIENAYQRQNQFVSDASHELRTPIAVIQGYTNLLDRWGKEDPAVLEEAIAAIKEEGEAMKELIEKLLFLARADKGQQILNKEMFSLKELVEEVVRETMLIEKDHLILGNCPQEVMFYGDRQSIKQLLRILVDNGIKFTPAGGQVSINLLQDRRRILLEVVDTGIGIARKELPYIFNRFYRSDQSRSKRGEGQGLGLSIGKWIIEQHGGRVEVESELGKGTKFKIIFQRR